MGGSKGECRGDDKIILLIQPQDSLALSSNNSYSNQIYNLNEIS